MKYYVYLLKNLKRLKKRVKKSNNLLRRKAMSTHNCYRQSRDYSTMEQIQQLFQLKYTDDLLKSLYHDTVSVLKGMDKQALLLVNWFDENADKNKIASFFDCSVRTLYRRLNVAMNKFVKGMVSLGYDENWFVAERERLGIAN